MSKLSAEAAEQKLGRLDWSKWRVDSKGEILASADTPFGKITLRNLKNDKGGDEFGTVSVPWEADEEWLLTMWDVEAELKRDVELEFAKRVKLCAATLMSDGPVLKPEDAKNIAEILRRSANTLATLEQDFAAGASQGKFPEVAIMAMSRERVRLRALATKVLEAAGLRGD